MEKKTLTASELREGKLLLRAPLPAILLLTFFFWVLGGGKSVAEDGWVLAQGLNMQVPAAHVASVVKLDKMGYYALATRDSVNEQQRVRMEASYAKVLGLDSGRVADSLVVAVRAKLADVKRVLGRAAAGEGASAGRSRRPARRELAGGPELTAGRGMVGGPEVAAGPDLQRLEKMMSVLQRNEGGNTEIAGLTSVIEKLAALQSPHGDTLQRRPAAVMKETALSVRTLSVRALSVRALPDVDDTLPGGFDSLAIEAMVSEEQVLVSGEELRLELVRDILLDGRRIPAGTAVYGVASLSGERLRVTISAIAWQDRIFPVNLQVDDEDGLAGIHIPGAPVTDAVRESLGSEAGAIGPTVLSTGLAGQALDAGISVGRSLVGKRVRPVRVTVPAGYRVLLHPQNSAL
jgi:hypothetical protein